MLLEGLSDLPLQGIRVHRFLQVADLLEEGLQARNDLLLAGGRGGEFTTVQARLGLAKPLVNLFVFDQLGGRGGFATHGAGETAGLRKVLLELAETGGHVALVLQGGKVQLRTAFRCFTGNRLRVLADLRLMLDQLLDLAGQLGDLQPPQEYLLFDLDPHQDLAALAPRPRRP